MRFFLHAPHSLLDFPFMLLSFTVLRIVLEDTINDVSQGPKENHPVISLLCGIYTPWGLKARSVTGHLQSPYRVPTFKTSTRGDVENRKAHVASGRCFMDKGACGQAWSPVCSPGDPDAERREMTPTHCPLTSTHVMWQCTHVLPK